MARRGQLQNDGRRHRRGDEQCRCDGCLADAYGYDWRRLVPGMGWLRDFVRWGLRVTDAPPIFIIAAGLSCLSTVVGAHCQFVPAASAAPIFLHMWILIGGTSAKPRKSTAVNMVEQVLDRNFSYFLVPSSGSPEAIYSRIAQQPQCVMVIPEFPAFLANLDKSYARSLKTDLMDLYDGKTTRRETRKKGNEEVIDPRVNLIGGAALDLLDRHLRDLDFRSGFLSRMFFVAGERKKWMPRQEYYPDHLSKLQDGLVDIAKWAASHPVIRASNRAETALNEISRMVENRGTDTGDTYGSLIDRLAGHAHKIAALYAASIKHKSVYESLVTERVLPMTEHCISVVDEYLIHMMSDSGFIRAAQRITSWLRESTHKQYDYIPFRELVNRSRDVKHAYAAVEQLEAQEILTRPLPSRHEGETRATSKVQLLKDPKEI